jgi:hypothetical protein
VDLTAARTVVSEIIIRRRTPGDPRFIVDLDDAPAGIGRDLLAFIADYKRNRDPAPVVGPDSFGYTDYLIDKMYAEAFAHLEKAARMMVAVDTTYNDRIEAWHAKRYPAARDPWAS